MQHNGGTYFPVDTPTHLGMDKNIKTFFFLKVVMLHIKLEGLEHRATCKYILCPYKHFRRQGWSHKVKTFFFLKAFMLHIKIMGKVRRTPSKHIFCGCAHPLSE